MDALTVLPKGVITLPDELMRHLGIGPGDRIALDLQPDGSGILKGIKVARKRRKSANRVSGRKVV